MIAGVGGQGNLQCGAVLADATMEAGLRPVVGETFGASRRGGGVITHLRISEEHRGPLIPQREVDLMLGMEPLEALRASRDFAGQRTMTVMSDMRVETMDTLSGTRAYPSAEEIAACLRDLCGELYVISPAEAMDTLGTSRVLNAYMIGAGFCLGYMPLKRNHIRAALEKMRGDTELNIRAFERGIEDAKSLTT
jgi:indolepyruvate ferredoxin oxidoreductase beta subunit